MNIAVDRERCVGAGMCALTAPEVFDQDDEDGRVVLLDTGEDRVEPARRAAVLCPSQAIQVTPSAASGQTR